MLYDPPEIQNGTYPVSPVHVALARGAWRARRLAPGVYAPGFSYNFDHELRDAGLVVETYPCYPIGRKEWGPSAGFSDQGDFGVADSVEQIVEHYRGTPVHDDPARRFVIGATCVRKADQPEHGGWRWHKWGRYIGEHEITAEYLRDEPVVEEVLCYHLYEVLDGPAE